MAQGPGLLQNGGVMPIGCSGSLVGRDGLFSCPRAFVCIVLSRFGCADEIV